MRAQATTSRVKRRVPAGTAASSDWLGYDAISQVLPYSARHIRRLAEQEGWRTCEIPGRGSDRKVYARLDVEAFYLTQGYVHSDLGGWRPIKESDLVARAKTATIPTAVVTETVEKRVVRYEHLSVLARQSTDDRVLMVTRYRTELQKDSSLTLLEFSTEWNATHPDEAVPYRTLALWVKKYYDGGVDALSDGRQTRPKFGPQIEGRLLDVFEKLYLDQAQITVRNAYWHTKKEAERLGIQCPSLKTFERYAKSLPKGVVVLARHGKKAWEDKAEPYVMRDFDALPANGLWVSDHHHLDVACKFPDGSIAFPWVTVWMDVRSRKFLGHKMGGVPNSNSIFTAFKRAAIENKTVPEEALMDNGKDYRSLALAGGRKVYRFDFENDPTTLSLMGRLGVTVHFARPYNARAKIIERYFRRVKEQFCRLFPTYRGGNVIERPQEKLDWAMAHPEQIPTFAELEAKFNDWVEHIYHVEPCGDGVEGIPAGMSPNQAWNEFLGTLRTANPETLANLCMRESRKVRVQRNGVKLLGQWYQNIDVLHKYLGHDVTLRYDPENVKSLFVYDIQGRLLCEADIVARVPYIGVSADVLKQAETAKRKAYALAKAPLDRLDAIPDRDFIAEAVAQNKGKAIPTAPHKDGLIIEPLEFLMVANGDDEEQRYAPPTRAMAAEAERRLRAALDKREANGGNKWKPRLMD